ncbi:hypothetical protein G4228_013944 [Cervus hanglu yarkandensis]|nr:hypothetical protein G4228_013944 [Cervus hanglu yarkandensis]
MRLQLFIGLHCGDRGGAALGWGKATGSPVGSDSLQVELVSPEAMSGEDQEVRAVVEDGSNGGSGSPSPGDTLPWNLEKTQRSRRGGGGPGGNGSVLDPAERAVIRIAGTLWVGAQGQLVGVRGAGGCRSPGPCGRGGTAIFFTCHIWMRRNEALFHPRKVNPERAIAARTPALSAPPPHPSVPSLEPWKPGLLYMGCAAFPAGGALPGRSGGGRFSALEDGACQSDG